MGVPDVVVVDHHDSYTWNLVHLVASVTGELPTVVQHDEVSAAMVLRYSHVLLSPGPGHPADEADFSVGREVLSAGTRSTLPPYASTSPCMPRQTPSTDRVPPAHGEVAAVTHDGRGVFAGLPQGFAAVRYHSLAAVDVPDELEVTATAGSVVMGVRHRTLPLEGVQFHPESILSEHGRALVSNWLGVA